MKRITVEEVRAAVEKTGLRLVPRYFGGDDGIPCSGCALTALWLSGNPKSDGNNVQAILDWAYNIYGSDYAEGFISGFDDEDRVLEGRPDRYVVGYDDGYEAREALSPTTEEQQG